jgi:hypothetical protein
MRFKVFHWLISTKTITAPQLWKSVNQVVKGLLAWHRGSESVLVKFGGVPIECATVFLFIYLDRSESTSKFIWTTDA